LKPLAIAAAMIVSTIGAAHADQYSFSLGYVAFVETAQRVCSLTAEQTKQADSAMEIQIEENNLQPGGDVMVLQHALDMWRHGHRQSFKLLRDADRESGVARKIVCDTALEKPDEPFRSTPFGYTESGYPKQAGVSCAAGFNALGDDRWCVPQ
jgi:hypothetical protein